MNFVTKRCVRKSIRLLIWWTHYSFLGVSIVGPKELFALELLPTGYLLTNLNAFSCASDDVCTQRSQDTGFICLTWRAPQGYYKAEHRFDKPNPYFFVGFIVQIDLLCVTRRLRYGRPSWFHIYRGGWASELKVVETVHRPLSRFDTHPRWVFKTLQWNHSPAARGSTWVLNILWRSFYDL